MLASATRSVSERAMSPIEQWMYKRGRVSRTGCLPFPLTLSGSVAESSWASRSGRGVRDGEGGSLRDVASTVVSSRPRPA